jgi:hypothetical protein
MNISTLSSPGLLSLYDAITAALVHDDAQHSPQAKTYGVRQYADWRSWADTLEADIRRRGSSFHPIPW